jgi:beta-lactamase superfamily II metal-dependent hydrolase
MIRIKSFSVNNGDMFYISHGSDNFTMIDCHLPNDDPFKKASILLEVSKFKDAKGLHRFISTHPDQDHIGGLKELDEYIDILNFYCVDNTTTKTDETEDFKYYKSLRDGEKSFHISRGCTRKWMNESCSERGSAGVQILWPILENPFYKEALLKAHNGDSPNNISPIIEYSLSTGGTFMWMGDLDTEFMENIKDEIDLPKVNVLFAPHHGRESGRVPKKWLEQMNPDIVIIGEAPSKNIHYYCEYNTITQNSAKNITFDLGDGVINVYTGNSEYSVDFLKNNFLDDFGDDYYLGTLEV